MKTKRLITRRLLPLAAVAALALFFVARRGAGTLPNRDPTGERFPSVAGRSLEEQPVELPAALAGQPAVLLIGYLQGAQFDIDRWLLGLLQAEVDATLVELPTIPGLVPTLASGWIDEGMRSGIPREDWGSVVTLYGAAARPVVELTGNEGGRRARVVVLDGEGRIVWFDDEGYSPRKALAVAQTARELRGED